MAKVSFGEHLKREREMRGVSLEEISAATRIGTRFLAALENEQWDRLPGGVFNRGFVRTVARFLGLDEESFVGEYALATDDQPAVAVRAVDSAGSRAQRWGLAALLVVLLGGVATGGWFGWRRVGGLHLARQKGPTPTAQAASPAMAPVATPPVASAPVPLSASNAPAEVTRAATAAASSRNTEPAQLELAVAAGKATTLKVIADGKTAFDARMAAGENRHFQAQERFEISVRDASAVLVELNGQTMAPLGPLGQPGRITLTRQDLKKPSGGPD